MRTKLHSIPGPPGCTKTTGPEPRTWYSMREPATVTWWAPGVRPGEIQAASAVGAEARSTRRRRVLMEGGRYTNPFRPARIQVSRFGSRWKYEEAIQAAGDELVAFLYGRNPSGTDARPFWPGRSRRAWRRCRNREVLAERKESSEDWHREVVQRGKGLRLHRAERGGRRVRPLLRDRGRGLQEPHGRRSRGVRGYDRPERALGQERPQDLTQPQTQ